MRRAPYPAAVLAVFLTAGVLPEAAAAAGPPRHIVVVLVDTLRADRLGAYGSTRGLTPFLDSLAARAVVFKHAYATAPGTKPSVGSLFTSRFPSQHGAYLMHSALPDPELTLAEVLQERGWLTAAFIATPVVSRRFGYAQGFSVYDEPKFGKEPPKRRAGVVNAKVFSWSAVLLGSQRPAFIYLHYMEPHLPYAPEHVFLDRARGERPRPDVERAGAAMLRANTTPPDDRTRQEIEDVYDAEVASFDAQLGTLFDHLRVRKLLDDTVVVLTADHGEAIGERGTFGHGGTLYDEAIHVPLLVMVPGQTVRRDVEEPVSLIDVAPTLVELAGAPVPASFEGRSLRPMLAADGGGLRATLARWLRPAEPRPVFSERLEANAGLPHHQRAVVLGSRKLIGGPAGEAERYDLTTDPRELRPDRRAGGDDLVEALAAFKSGPAREAAPAGEGLIDPEMRERLKALGYVN